MTAEAGATLKSELDDDGVLLLTLNRPEKKNAFREEEWDGLARALDGGRSAVARGAVGRAGTAGGGRVDAGAARGGAGRGVGPRV